MGNRINYLCRYCSGCCGLNMRYWYRKYFDYTTPGTVIMLALKEVFEASLQNVAFYFYAGSQNQIVQYFEGFGSTNDNTKNLVILAEDAKSVKLFAWIIGTNCMILGIMWLLYLVKNKTLDGKFFIFIMFAVDAVFDLFFALFPLMLINTQNIEIIIGSLNTQSPIVFLTSFVPMIFLTRKLRKILYLLTNSSTKEFVRLFNKKTNKKLSNVKNDDNNYNFDIDFTNNEISIELRTVSSTTPRSGSLTPSLQEQKQEQERQPKQQVKPQSQTSIANSQSVADEGVVMSGASRAIGQEKSLSAILGNLQVVDSLSHDGKQYTFICCDENSFNQCPKGCQDGCNICFHGPTCLTPIPLYDKHKSIFIVQYIRRILLLILSLAFCFYSIYIISTTVYFFNVTTQICDQYNQYTNGFNIEYPHLYVWPNCIYKVYPIFDELPCNCRSLYVLASDVQQWEFINYDYNYNYNLTSKSDIVSYIVESSLEKYYMAETLHFHTTTLGVFKNGLTDKHMTAHKIKLISLNGVSLYSISDSLGGNWPRLEFLRFYNVVLTQLPADSLGKLTKLKYFNIIGNNLWVDQSNETQIQQELEFLCELELLEVMDLSRNGQVALPVCVYDENTLLNLQWVSFGLSSGFDVRLLAKENLRGISAIVSSIDASNFGDSEFKYNLNENTAYYLQGTPLCNYWISNVLKASNVTKAMLEYELEYPWIYQFLTDTNACAYVCDNYENSQRVFQCLPYVWQDGVCNPGCNTEGCHFDGGDCLQLCNLDMCDYKSLGDGNCDSNCNNTGCAFDMCDCGIPIPSVPGSCFDYYDCIVETECHVTFVDNITLGLASESWINDGYCDNFCNNKYCNYDGDDCNSCTGSGAYNCDLGWDVFMTIANSTTYDHLISIDEGCNYWEYFQLLDIFATENDYNYEKASNNCTYGVLFFDQNGDQHWNFFEFQQLLLLDENTNKTNQINCSFCAPSVEIYYDEQL